MISAVRCSEGVEAYAEVAEVDVLLRTWSP